MVFSIPFFQMEGSMDKLTYIEVGKEKYPIKCDNLVLQQIQEEFGSGKQIA